MISSSIDQASLRSYPSLSLFISSLVCIHLGYLRTDLSSINQASLFLLTLISLSFALFSFIFIYLYFILMVCVYELVVINLFNFFRHYKLPPFHTVIRIHLISSLYHILVVCHLVMFLWTNVNVKCYDMQSLEKVLHASLRFFTHLWSRNSGSCVVYTRSPVQ